MLPLRIAFDVVAKLRFTDVEYAAALYAASTLSMQRGTWAPPSTRQLAEAMDRPRVLELLSSGGVAEALWRERIETVRDSEVLALAIEFLFEHERDVPQAWLDELPRAARRHESTAPSSATV